MKINYLLQFLFAAFLLISCDREEIGEVAEEDPLVTKLSVRMLDPGAMPVNNAEMSYDFSYDGNQRLTKKVGGFLPVSGSAGYNFLYFSKKIQTEIQYNGNNAVVEDVSTSPDFSVQKNTRNYTLNTQNQIIGREIPNANVYWFKKEVFVYKNGKLDEIKTTLPNMPYDPSDPDDHIFTYSEKFFYDSAGNLAKTEYLELQDGVPSNYYKRVRLFENYDSSYNPFKRFALLDNYFYRSLSKNNFRVYKEQTTENGSTLTSTREWSFNYDAGGNIILD